MEDDLTQEEAKSNSRFYIPPVDTSLGIAEKDEKSSVLDKNEPCATPSSAEVVEKKGGFFNSIFSAFKRKSSIVTVAAAVDSTTTDALKVNENKRESKVVMRVKKKTFAEIANKVLKSIREKKREANKAKFALIVDMVMAQRASTISQISQRQVSNDSISSSEESIKRSRSCPFNLNMLRVIDETTISSNLKQSSLSCSCSIVFSPSATSDEKPTERIIPSESSFESTDLDSLSVQESTSRPLMSGKFMKTNTGPGVKCNKAIVKASVKKAFRSKPFGMQSLDATQQKVPLGKTKGHFRKITVKGDEGVNYRNLVKLQLRNKFDQIYLCAFQIVLHPETLEPVIIWINPEYTDVDDLYNYRDFCFPEMKSKYKNYKYKETDLKTYRFVRTKIDGTKEYGYCRKYISKNDKTNLPMVFCLVSKVDAFLMYDQILEELGRYYYKQDLEMVHLFLICLHTKPLPAPGGPSSYMKLSHDRYLVLQRNSDNRQTGSSCDYLLRFLGIENIIRIVTAILSENSVIVFSNKLSNLSRVMDAIRSLIYPFSWPYSYVPVMPSHLIDHCESPCPFLIGAIADNFDDVMSRNLSDVVLVHLNRNKVFNYNEADMNTLPENLTKTIVKLCNKIKVLFKSDKFLEMTISEGFLQLFIELFHNYNEFKTSGNEFKVTPVLFQARLYLIALFKNEEFVMSQEDLSYRKFLARFCETNVFQDFLINFVEKPSANKTVFEERVREYNDEESKQKKK